MNQKDKWSMRSQSRNALAGFALICLPLGQGAPANGSLPKAQTSASDFVTILPSGTVVRVLGVEDSSGGTWAPTGGPIAADIKKRIFGDVAVKGWEPKHGVVMYFDLLTFHTREAIGVTPRYVGDPLGGTFIQSRTNIGEDKESRSYSGYLYVADPKVDQAELDVGIAEGAFKPIAACVRAGKAFRSVLGKDLKPQFRHLHNGTAKGTHPESPSFEMKCDVPDINADGERFDTRLVLFNSRGPLPETFLEETVDEGPVKNWLEHFCHAKDIVRIEFRTRPILWVKFKGVHLQPNSTKA